MISKFSIDDQIFLSQKLNLLLNSGISLVESLKIILSLEKKKNKKIFYRNIIDECDRGVSLSKSLINSNVKFEPLFINMIRNGEYSGDLPLSLVKIADSLEKKNEMRKKIIGVLVYPVFIFIATIAMSIFLILYIFPKILPMLSSMGMDLPLPTKVLKAVYEVATSSGIYIISISISIISILFLIYKRVYKIKLFIHKYIIYLPIYGMYIKLKILKNICNIGSLLLSSGRSLGDFYIFISQYSDNLFYKIIFENISISSDKGISFVNSIRPYDHHFTNIMVNMCSIGERTGNLADMFRYISDIYDDELNTYLKRLSSLLEPVLMIFMGIVVGSIALSIILPVYEITNHLNNR